MQLLLKNLDSRRKQNAKITHQSKTWTGSSQNNGKMIVDTSQTENVHVYRSHLETEKKADRFEIMTYGCDKNDKLHAVELNLNHNEAMQLLNELTKQLLG